MRRTMLVALACALTVALAGACEAGSPVQPPFVGASVVVQAANIAFAPTEITLPAGTPLRIVLDNQDAGIPHDIRVFQGDREIAKSATVSGPAQTEVRFGPLPAARYQFACDVHPSMVGTLIVTP